MPLKFGDPASIAQVKQLRIAAARQQSLADFPTKAIVELADILEDILTDYDIDHMDIPRSVLTNAIRGWLDRIYEEREA